MAVLRVVESFAVVVNGVPRVLRAGDLVDENDPCVKSRPAWWFEPVQATAERLREQYVEQATAAPGERRRSGKPPAASAEAE